MQTSQPRFLWTIIAGVSVMIFLGWTTHSRALAKGGGNAIDGRTHSAARSIATQGNPYATPYTGGKNASTKTSYSGEAARPTRPAVVEQFANVPLSFESNIGQVEPNIRFLSRGPGYLLLLTPTGSVLALRKPDHTGKTKPTASKPRKTQTRSCVSSWWAPTAALKSRDWTGSRGEPTTSSAMIRKSGGRMFRLMR